MFSFPKLLSANPSIFKLAFVLTSQEDLVFTLAPAIYRGEGLSYRRISLGEMFDLTFEISMIPVS